MTDAAARDRLLDPEQSAEPPTMLPFPAEFSERMRRQLGDEARAFFQALANPPQGLRVNTLRVDPADFRRIAPFELVPLSFPEDGFLLPAEARAGLSPYHAAGLYYLQDPGAMAAGELVGAQPGERVLDLAAAPGGKSTQIASRMGGEGLLVANDPHLDRARELAGNLERWGVANAVVTAESVERLATHFGPWFDRVLLDAPCSGEAMFHKTAAACADWSLAGVAGCARRQAGLLEAASHLVCPGGSLSYSTCTFSPEENEQVIAAFLDAHSDFSLADMPQFTGASEGRPDWAPDSPRRDELRRAVRLWPHRFPGAGHFVAALVKHGGSEAVVSPRPRRGDIPRDARAAWEGFRADAVFADSAAGSALELRGELLFALPPGLPDLTGLRVIRPGLLLGTVRKGRLDPAHALALTLRPADVRSYLTLAADSSDAAAYLRGETLAGSGPPGWILVTVDGYPLGWGKRVGTTVKNHYPKGLRRPASGRARP